MADRTRLGAPALRLVPARGGQGTVVASNIFRPGSTWEIRATRSDGGTRVEVIGVRHLSGIRGRLLYPFLPLGMAERSVAAHLRHFLSTLEAAEL